MGIKKQQFYSIYFSYELIILKKNPKKSKKKKIKIITSNQNQLINNHNISIEKKVKHEKKYNTKKNHSFFFLPNI